MWLFGLPLTDCTCQQRPSLEKSQAVIRELIGDLDAYRIEGIEVFYIPASVWFFAPMTPAELKTQYQYRISVQHTGVSALAPGLLSALRQTHLKKVKASSDIRWALVFKLTQDVHREIYMDRTGRAGIIEDVPVELGDHLSAWLKHVTSTLP